MKNEIPENFRLVDLDRPRTWSNATLAEWAELRRHLKSRLKDAPSGAQRFRTWAQVSIAARQQLRKEDAEAERRTSGPLTGLQRKRLEEIMRGLWPPDDDPSIGLNDWERKFMRESEWIDDILEGNSLWNPRKIIEGLFWWVHDVEITTDLRSVRAEERARRRASIAPVADAGKRLPRNANPFLPHPLELVYIHRIVVTLIHGIRVGMKNAVRLNVIRDEYGAAYPCPRCKRRYVYIHESMECCKGELTTSEVEVVNSYMNCIPPGSVNNLNEIVDLYRSLWKASFETAVTVDDMVAWPRWKEIQNVPPMEFAKEVIGYMFSASPSTIRRKLARRDLLMEYRKHRVPKRFRAYLDYKVLPISNLVPTPGWFTKFDEDGVPESGAFHLAIFKVPGM